MKPVLFVTGNVPAYRVGALERLHESEGIEVALFGGRSLHGGAVFKGQMGFPHRNVDARQLARIAASGRHRAVVCPTGGRLSLLATWAGARRARTPLILWASLRAHPRTAAHALSYAPLRRLYRSADAVVTYGPHVSAYVRARGARNVHVAPQSIDNAYWRAGHVAALGPERGAAARFLFVGRPDPEKGEALLLSAWRACGLAPPEAELLLVGAGEGPTPAGVIRAGTAAPELLRGIYESSDVLVVPSIRTRAFLEPWGLVCNEAMNRGLAVIASDAVGAAAGGLVHGGENGIVFPAGDEQALAAAIGRLARDPADRRRMGLAGARDVLAYSHEAWAAGFSGALATLGLSASIGSVA